MLQACLNGNRTDVEHPAVPRTPAELAADGRVVVEVGADLLHFHAYGPDGHESLAAGPCADAIRAVRAACPGVPISLTTSAEIEPDPTLRLELVAGWTELPELVTANQGEPGILELCELLLSRGVGIEAGLLSLADARAFVAAGIADRCVRVLVEPLDADPASAVRHAAAMEDVLAQAGVTREQVHHGDGIAHWAVVRRAVARGHGIRAGLEDCVVLPDGRRAAGNAELVTVAAELAA